MAIPAQAVFVFPCRRVFLRRSSREEAYELEKQQDMQHWEEYQLTHA